MRKLFFSCLIAICISMVYSYFFSPSPQVERFEVVQLNGESIADVMSRLNNGETFDDEMVDQVVLLNDISEYDGNTVMIPIFKH